MDVFVSIVLVVFPILMYLVFSSFNSLVSNKIEKVVFIITMCSSLYFCFKYDLVNRELFLLCNIPILICYFKKELVLSLILSIIIIIGSYFIYDYNVYFISLKLLCYFIIYILLYKKKEFNYLFFKISAIIQGFLLSFEYFMNINIGIDNLINIIIYIFMIYALIFFCLYLFKLADNIKELYLTVNKVREENKIRDSLFKLTHEIKNPIAVCKGYLDMINLDNIDKSKKYISIIKSEIDRSLNVIADYMEYNKIKINKEPIDIIMLMDEIYDSFKLLTNSKNIKFNYINNYSEIYLDGDYDRLKQVFVNIIKNSIEAINDSGIIDIDIKRNIHDVIITFSDNGVGMTLDELTNIKEMFYTTKRNGTGLGVALSNEIIMAHDGTLEYESKKNIGTKCIVKLPL